MLSLKKLIALYSIFTAGSLAAQQAPHLINSYTPAVQSGNNVWVHLDFLYWKAWEKSLVLTNQKSPVFFTDDFTRAKVIHPHFSWDPGYRVGLGYLFSSHLWDFTLDWTHYHTSLDQHRSTNSNDLTTTNPKGMFPIWSLSDDIIAGDYVTSADLDWKLTINLIDLEFGRYLKYKNWFEIRPYFGLRSCWVKQRMDIDYSGGIFLLTILDGGVSLPGTDEIEMKNNFWGIGPKVGLEPRFILGKGVSIYGEAAISGLLGYFSLKQKETYLETTRFSFKDHPCRFRWIGDFGAGLSWKSLLCHDRFALTLKAGYEYLIFFKQMELKTDDFHLVSGNKNLDVQGVTLSGRFDF